DFPLVRESTLNFGLPDLIGRSASSADIGGLEVAIREAIIAFEPRLLPDSVKVRRVPNPASSHPNALSFAIEAELWMVPVPLSLQLRTYFDLENARAQVFEAVADSD